MMEPNTIVGRARALISGGKPDDALQVLEDGIAAHRNNFAIHLARCALLRKLGHTKDYRLALSDLKRDHPDKPGLLVEMAADARGHGEIDKAMEHLNAALALNPTHGAALSALTDLRARTILGSAQALQDDGNDHGALKSLNSGLAEYPDAFPLVLARAVLLGKMEQSEQYAAALSDLQSRYDKKPGALIELAAHARRQGNFKSAAKFLGAALSVQPGHRGAMLANVSLAEDQADFDAALRHLDAFISTHKTEPKLARRRAAILRRLGRIVQSRDCLSALYRGQPDDVELITQLAKVTTILEPDLVGPLLRQLRELDPDTPQVGVIEIGLAMVFRDATWAHKAAKAAARSWPDHPAVAIQRAKLCLQAYDPKGAMAALDGLPQQFQAEDPVRMARASALMNLAEYDQAENIFASILDSGILHAEAMTGYIRAANKSANGPGKGAAAIAKMRALIDEYEAKNGHLIGLRFRAEIARCIGDWSLLGKLSSEWQENQPRDMRGKFLAALASLGTGDLQSARTHLDGCLGQNPFDHDTLVLADRLALALGQRGGTPAAHNGQKSGKMPFYPDREIAAVRDLFHLGQIEEARAALDRCAGLNGTFPNPELAYELELQGCTADADRIKPKADKAGVPEAAMTTPIAHFNRMFDFDAGLDCYPDMPDPVAMLAWRLGGQKNGPFTAWQKRAHQASEANRELSQRPVLPAELVGLIDWPSLDALEDLARDGKPALLVTSHFGPMVHNALLARLPNLHYLMMRGPYDAPPSTALGSWTMFDGNTGRAAASVVRALRRGKFVLSLPDVPAQFSRRGQPGTHARGDLFGVPCAIVDTVPKLCQAMSIPSTWVQPIWRLGRIGFQAQSMPVPQTGEDSQVWSDRWAQAYLDLTAGIMTSGPENQDFRAPILQFLSLNAARVIFPAPSPAQSPD